MSCQRCGRSTPPGQGLCGDCAAAARTVAPRSRRAETLPASLRLAGREAALQWLYALHAEALARGAGLVAVVQGRAGVGRRRLASHFARWLAEESGGRIGAAHPSESSSGRPYGLIEAALRGVDPPALPDPDRSAGRTLTPSSGPEQAPPQPNALQAASLLLRAATGDVAELPELARRVAALLVDAAAAAQIHLVLSDIDRADDASLRLLIALTAELRAPTVTVVCTASPDLAEREVWTWPLSERAPEVLELLPLTEPETETLLRRLLDGVAGVPPTLARVVFEQSAGLPGRVVQFVRNLMGESVITADGEGWRFQPSRFDPGALGRGPGDAGGGPAEGAAADPDRELLRAAAMCGRSAWAEGVALLMRGQRRDQATRALWDGTPLLSEVRRRLRALAATGVLAPTEETSLPGAEAYTFTSRQLQAEVAAEVPDGHARLAHGLLAEWLGCNRPEQPSVDRIELEALHFEQAGRRVSAARRYHEAGALCHGALEVQRARAFWDAALRICGERDRLLRMEVLHALGGAAATAGDTDDALRLFTEMLELAWLMDHKAKGGAAYNRIGRLHRERGNLDRAMDCVMTAWGLFESAGDAQGVAACIDDLGQLHQERGHFSEAVERFEQALERRRAMGDRRSIALSLHNIGSVVAQLGRPEEALRTLRRALDLRKQLGHISDVMSSLATIGRVLQDLDRAEEARDVWEEGLTLSQGAGNRQSEAQFRTLLGAYHLARGQAEAALAHLEVAAGLAARLSDTRVLAECHTHLAVAIGRLEGTKAAVPVAEQAAAYAREAGNPTLTAAALRVLGDLAVETGRLEEALELLGEAVRELTSGGDRGELLRVLQTRAALLSLVDQAAAAAADRRWIEDLQAPTEGPTKTQGGLLPAGRP